MLSFRSLLEHPQVALSLLCKKLSNLHPSAPAYLPLLPLSPNEPACFPLGVLSRWRCRQLRTSPTMLQTTPCAHPHAEIGKALPWKCPQQGNGSCASSSAPAHYTQPRPGSLPRRALGGLPAAAGLRPLACGRPWCPTATQSLRAAEVGMLNTWEFADSRSVFPARAFVDVNLLEGQCPRGRPRRSLMNAAVSRQLVELLPGVLSLSGFSPCRFMGMVFSSGGQTRGLKCLMG